MNKLVIALIAGLMVSVVVARHVAVNTNEENENVDKNAGAPGADLDPELTSEVNDGALQGGNQDSKLTQEVRAEPTKGDDYEMDGWTKASYPVGKPIHEQFGDDVLSQGAQDLVEKRKQLCKNKRTQVDCESCCAQGGLNAKFDGRWFFSKLKLPKFLTSCSCYGSPSYNPSS